MRRFLIRAATRVSIGRRMFAGALVAVVAGVIVAPAAGMSGHAAHVMPRQSHPRGLSYEQWSAR
jgi:hypothetical protein